MNNSHNLLVFFTFIAVFLISFLACKDEETGPQEVFYNIDGYVRNASTNSGVNGIYVGVYDQQTRIASTSTSLKSGGDAGYYHFDLISSKISTLPFFTVRAVVSCDTWDCDGYYVLTIRFDQLRPDPVVNTLTDIRIWPK